MSLYSLSNQFCHFNNSNKIPSKTKTNPEKKKKKKR